VEVRGQVALYEYKGMSVDFPARGWLDWSVYEDAPCEG